MVGRTKREACPVKESSHIQRERERECTGYARHPDGTYRTRWWHRVVRGRLERWTTPVPNTSPELMGTILLAELDGTELNAGALSARQTARKRLVSPSPAPVVRIQRKRTKGGKRR